MIVLTKESIKQVYLQQLKKEWLQASDNFPDFLVRVAPDKKQENERYIKSTVQKIQKQLNKKSSQKTKSKEKVMSFLNDALSEETILGIHTVMDSRTLTDFQDEMKKLLRWIRKFAPQLELVDIGQAMRNYVVYAMFNELNGLKQACTPAIFGYSMLYPFTDNFIDNPLQTAADKQAYNQLIRDKINGLPVTFATKHHQKTCELLSAVESEYPRGEDSNIYKLLLYMLEAQEDSIRQQRKSVTLTPEERLDISLYKGGISVLIDRYFVHKELTEADLHFYLGFGFFLQLADDLQDITEDSGKLNQTIMTYEANCGYVERTVNRLFYYAHSLFHNYETENMKFKAFILENCCQLIFMSVYGSKEHFSEDYLSALEPYFPVSFAFTEELKENQMKKKDLAAKSKYMKLLDEMLEE